MRGGWKPKPLDLSDPLGLEDLGDSDPDPDDDVDLPFADEFEAAA